MTDAWSVAPESARSSGTTRPGPSRRRRLGRDVLLYVHGYRESFESAAASAPQLADGIAFRGAPALFTWPSAASTLSYVSDRESAHVVPRRAWRTS